MDADLGGGGWREAERGAGVGGRRHWSGKREPLERQREPPRERNERARVDREEKKRRGT